ncbi:MAG: AAA family ATPase [Pseudomonadota bacterium]|nr:AAA family ATPase [Pseudomonadota bacterium]
MKFTKFYSDEQKQQVDTINNHLEIDAIDITDIACGFEFSHVKKVLCGESPVNPAKILDVIWAHMFGQEPVENFLPKVDFQSCYNEEDKALVSQIVARMNNPELKDNGVTLSSIADSLSISKSSISQLLNGKYRATPTKHLHNIWGLIEPANTLTLGNKEERIHIRYGEVPFIETSLSKIIKISCDQAQDRRRFSVFSGQAGLGKTRAIEQYCKQNDKAILIYGSEETSSKQILEQLCIALGLPKTHSKSAAMDKIIYALRDSGRLIILDEADKCKPNALDPLRTISDRAYIGVTLIGNNQLIDKLQTQERYELIRSRVCFWPKPVGQLQVEDIQTLFMELTKGQVKLESTDDKWWNWLHKRTEGNARELVENLLPHVLKLTHQKKEKALSRLSVNGIFSTVLNKPAV